MTLISATGLRKQFRGQDRPAIDEISLSVSPGETIAVVGHNGAGKSTLFDLLGGLTKADSGTISLDVRSSDIGWCPQREIIDWSLTVRQNILLGLNLRGVTRKRDSNSHLEELAHAMGLTEYMNRTAETLSGGELRRTQIARAMAGSPPLMILDEPTTGLDPSGILDVFSYLEKRRLNGAAALISTHETSRFAAHCTRVIAISAGRLIADLPVHEFMSVAPESEDLWDSYLARVEA